MAEVRAFRGARYATEVAGELGTLIAPPYDAASPEHFAFLRALNPFNIVHLEQAEADEDNGIDHHAVAAAGYRAWREEGVLRQDPRPASYLYRQTFSARGQRVTQQGIITTVRLADWSEQIILPHEETFPGPRQERLARLRAVRANLSPIYLLYADPAGELRQLLGPVSQQPADVAGVDPAGDRHEITVIEQPALLDRLASFFTNQRLYVADGHHRYEAALAFRDEVRHAGISLPETEFILATLVEINDPGVRVLPTHRLLHGLPNLGGDWLRDRLGRLFELHACTRHDVDDLLADPRTICLLRQGGESDVWQIRAKPGDPHAALLPPERSAAWRQLPVSILREVILRHIIGLAAADLPEHVSFAHDLATVDTALATGAAEAAFLVRPTSMPELLAVADAGERMPPKSTYFQPKIPAGLVLHDFG